MNYVFQPLTAEDQELIYQIKSKVLLNSIQATLDNCHQQPASPASLADIHRVETQIGSPLPPLIREIFFQVGDGGFGPAHGITGLTSSYLTEDRSFVDHVLHTAQDIKAHLSESIAMSERAGAGDARLLEQDKRHLQHWNALGLETLIWYCNWGCNIVTVVDFGKPELPIFCADGLDIRAENLRTLREWWWGWVDGSLIQP
ncbi:MAG: hypothetical protein J0M07_07625 [Anaerolineae bacterium]|nr:hypothetical protein [Chloroflexota bacterium]MBN8635178.1 hypothetical protein [Anaerolineae bacterium]